MYQGKIIFSQIMDHLPITLLTKLIYPAKTGLPRVGENTWLYVSRGTGTWGPPIRFLASPELTVIELRSAIFLKAFAPLQGHRFLKTSATHFCGRLAWSFYSSLASLLYE